MKKSILLLLFSFSALAMESDVVPRDINPEISEIFLNKKMVKQEIIKEDEISPYELQTSFTYWQGKFKQSGDGQNYDTETAPGVGATLEVLKKNGESFIRLNGWLNNATFKEPNTIGGKEVTVKRQQVTINYGKQNIFSVAQLSAEVGAGTIIQTADSFTDSEKLVPEYFSLGPSAALRWNQGLNDSWTWISSMSILAPLMFKDIGSTSGSHSYGLYSSLGTQLRSRLNRHLFISIGVMLEWERHVFSGEGERGVADADVSYVAFVVPVGLNYVF
jgi:hypothetical protein